jgi:O-acetylserine/cysteine efflux transporter
MCKFGLVFGSLSVGLSPGIASLALQTQVLFTILFSALIFKTKITPKQILGTLTSLTGMGIIAFQEHGGGNILGFAFILCAAVVWAFSNILYRKAKDVDAFALTIWMGIFPPLPFFALSVGVDGWDSVLHTLTHFDTKLTLCLGFIVVCASWIGSTCWAYLFKKYDASVVAPYSLLIPVFGILTSWLFLGESYSPMAMVACAIIFAGLIINQWPIKKNA